MRKIGLLFVLLVPCLALTQPILPVQATSKLVALYRRSYFNQDPTLEEVKALIALGADVNAPCVPNNLLLHVAVLNDWPDHVQVLLETPGIEVDKTHTGTTTALHQAICSNCRGIIEMLLEAGADANAQFKYQGPNSERNRNILGQIADESLNLVYVTPLMYAAISSPSLIPLLAPYARVDMTHNHPTLGPLTELERIVLCNFLRAETAIPLLLLEGTCADHLSESAKLTLRKIAGPDCCSTLPDGVIRATGRIRLHEVLKDPTDLAKRLQDLPKELPLAARDNIDHALLNAVRNDLAESAKVLLQAGASPMILTRWLLLHQSNLSPVQQRFFDELRPSRVLLDLQGDASSWFSWIPQDIVDLIAPLIDHARRPLLPVTPSIDMAARAAL